MLRLAMLRSISFLSYLLVAFLGLVQAQKFPPAHFLTEDLPSHLEHRLNARAEFLPNQLWNESGPSIKDVRQKAVLDCWWAAASVAVLSASPECVKSLLIDQSTNTSYLNHSSPSPLVDQLSVINFNPHSLEPMLHTASISNRSQTEDFGMKGYWWNDALTQGLLNLGRNTDVMGVHKDGTFNIDTGSASQPLTILTGYPSAERLFKDYNTTNGDELWEDFKKAPKSPVVFTTIDKPTKTDPEIGDNHAYPIMETQEDGEGRWVVARNVWGRTDRFRFEDVRANGWLVAHLQDWKELDWHVVEGKVNSVIGSTSSSSPSSTSDAIATSTASNTQTSADSSTSPTASSAPSVPSDPGTAVV